MNVLVIDIGGSHVKMLASGGREPRQFDSDKYLTPGGLVEKVKDAVGDWQFDVVTLGYPGQVRMGKPSAEPGNLGHGWVGYDFSAALGKPVRIINDAAMQAIGAFDGGRMLAAVNEAVEALGEATSADYVVLGGGHASEVHPLPSRARRGGNEDAFTGGFRLWEEWVEPHDRPASDAWRVFG